MIQCNAIMLKCYNARMHENLSTFDFDLVLINPKPETRNPKLAQCRNDRIKMSEIEA